MRYFSMFLIAMLLLGTQPPMSVSAAEHAVVPPENSAAVLAAPTSVTIAGSLQSEAGCGGDWDPACAATHLTFDATDQVWQGVFALPGGSYEYKAALDDSWTVNYGANAQPGGSNIGLVLGSTASVKFYYSDNTHWVTDNVNKKIATVAGSFQSELGCPGDWQPDCLRSWLQDPDGDGVYTFSSSAIPAGSYEFKVALDEGWTTSYPGSNLNFTVAALGQGVDFTYDSSTNAVTVTVQPASNNIFWDQLGHNSRDPLYRNPQGAIPTGTPIKLRLRAADGDLTAAKVRVWNDRTDTQAFYDMTKIASNVALPGDPGPYEFWEVTLPASADPTVYWYRFIAIDGTATAYYEDDAARTGGWGQTFGSSSDYGYQLTIYDAAFQTPDWIKNAVVYQVFPDRFRDGTPGNDPVAGGFFYGNNDTIVRSNTPNWNAPICDPRARPGSTYQCTGAYSQNFYGGDLQGIIDKLDYIDSLGVTAIYLNPIFESPSNHKYDTSNYGQIDDNFGDLATFQALVAAADAKGIKIILDGVFNHVSSDSPYMDRYGRYAAVGACESASSPYRGWFYFTDVTPGTGICVGSDGTANAANYTSWFGYESLPKLRSSSTAVRDLIWANASPSPTGAIAPYWIDQGASGWRLDVAGDIDPGTLNDPTNDYWEGFRSAVHTSNPQTYIVGEEWGNATSWTIGGEWDATMNYQFSAAVLSFWRDTAFTDNDFNSGSSMGPLNPLTAEGVNERLLNLKERYAPEAFAAMLNLFGSHDTNRALFLLDHNAGSHDTALYNNPAYDWSDSISRLRGAALMQMTMPGAPTIYYGDEIGLVGPVAFDGSQWQDDPYNRQPYPWLDASGTPYYNHLQNGSTTRTDLLAYYQTLTNTRNTTPALRTGSFDPLWTENGSDIYAYGRKMDDDSSAAVVVVNKADSAGSVTLDLSGYLPAGATLTDALTSTTFPVNASGQLVLGSVPAHGGLLLTLGSFTGRPTAPAITATAGSGIVTVNWASTGADSYDVYRSQVSGGGYIYQGNSTGVSYDDTTVVNGTHYYYVVVAKNDTALLKSDFSNEAGATPAYVIDWADLQWPPTIDHVVSLVTPTPDIYGQVYIGGGVTAAAGATTGLIAQVGYGDNGTLPTDASWQWFDASFDSDQGNNDQFIGNLLVASAGDFDYLYRYSTDGGSTWVYGAYNGIFYSTLVGYDPANAGQMTVTASTDVTPPAAPTNLAVASTTASSISLAWDTHPNTDGDLYGFEIWRRNVTDGEIGFTKIKLLAGATANSYTDGTVSATKTYEYYIKAVDNSVNVSDASNTVSADAVVLMVHVTFSVTVPNPSPGTVYVVGSFGGFPGSIYPTWDPGGIAMTESSPNLWQVTLDIPDSYGLQYKYARGTWDKGEKQADGNTEIPNRTLTVDYGGSGIQTVNDTVANWRDPIVNAFSPADGAVGQPNTSTITATWNQVMSAPADAGYVACVTVTGPGGAVTGTVTYDSGLQQYIFTPASVLDAGLQTVNIAGCKDVAGDLQQAAATWTFQVADTIIPTVDTFTATSPTNSLNIPITAFTASDNVAVTDYLITESATVPAAGDAGWSGTAPTIYTVPSAGTYTLYPWAKDAEDNVSAVFATPPTVVVDNIAPTVDTFTATTPTDSLNIPITAFSASDNVAVTEYLITESATIPSSGAVGWTGTVPTTYAVARAGTYTLYPWAKDAVGNVSAAFGSPRTVVVTAGIDVLIAGASQGTYNLSSGGSTRQSYAGVNNGPVKVNSTGGAPILAAQRILYTGTSTQPTSFVEMMGLPDGQVDKTYWFPWYKNDGIVDTQIRIGNVSASTATVHIYVAGVEVMGSPFTLTTSGAGQSQRLSFALNDGPVKIVSDQNIVATERLIYFNGSGPTSFSEMMGLPNSQLSTTYWFPWYKNAGEVDTQLRIGNVSGSDATVHIYIAGVEVAGSPFTLTTTGAGQSQRLNFAGVNDGPVKIVSDQNIVASQRILYYAGGVPTSFVETMGIPDSQLGTTHWFPWYKNDGIVDTQLRIGNVSGTTASVHVYIAGVEVTGSPFTLTATGAGQSQRLSFAGVNDGPVKIVSDQNIVTSERLIYFNNGVPVSFSEMMGLPDNQLSASYWLPWYKNIGEIDTQLRFAVP